MSEVTYRPQWLEEINSRDGGTLSPLIQMIQMMLEETDMSKKRVVNGVLLIGGIVSFLFIMIAAILGLPGWMIIVGATMNAVLHLFYQPIKQVDPSETERLKEELERVRQERQNGSFGMEKVLRIREEYEKKIQSIEEENRKKIAELERARSQEEKDTQHIEELENARFQEEKNAQRIVELENALAQEKKNVQRIAELESALAQEKKNAQRIAELESALAQEEKNAQRIAELESALAQEEKNAQRIVELENALAQEEKNTQRIAELENALAQEEKNVQRIAELESALAQEEKNTQRITELENVLSKEGNDAQRIVDLERELAAERERCQRLKIALEQNRNTTYDASILPELDPDEDKLVKVDAVEFAKRVADRYTKEAEEAGIDIYVAGEKGSIFIQASEKMLLVLFQNIIDNSIKYMNRKGIMQITITDLDDDIIIVIKDSGRGLSENETTHIFELNFQGSNRVSGNGLGLAQVKAIVEYYGGMVYAKSSTDKGMGIYIHLPATKEAIS